MEEAATGEVQEDEPGTMSCQQGHDHERGKSQGEARFFSMRSDWRYLSAFNGHMA